MAAVDKNAGDRRYVAAGRRGGDERVATGSRISLSCSRGQLARWGGLGGAVRSGIRCRRRRAAKGAASGAAGCQSDRGAGGD